MILNCVNCGAPIDNKKTKCPYCETPYKVNLFNRNFSEKKNINKTSCNDVYLSSFFKMINKAFCDIDEWERKNVKKSIIDRWKKHGEFKRRCLLAGFSKDFVPTRFEYAITGTKLHKLIYGRK